MTHSESIKDLATALAKAQSEIEGAAKDKTNPHFKSAYADLASVWDACRVPLTKNGLSVAQEAGGDGTKVTVVTLLTHSSGQWMRGELTMIPQKNDPQGMGSCITYARRYALSAMVGVAPEDDDANQASGKSNGQAQQHATKADLPIEPEGYREWRIEMNLTAERKGRMALNELWGRSEAAYRDHLRKTEPEAIDKLRAVAAKVKEPVAVPA